MEERSTYPNPRGRGIISRRGFLTGAALFTAGAAVTGAIYEAWETWKALHRQPIPYNAELSATATAASERGLETTLKAETPFTMEMIQRVRNNTGFVILELANESKIVRSAWLAQGPGEGYNIVTSAHYAFGGNTVGSNGKSTIIQHVLFGRPYIDESFAVLDASKCTFAVGGSKRIPQDVALITIPRANFPEIKTPPEGIPFRDNYTPKIGDSILFAGYPHEFQNPDDLLLSLTEGDVTRVTDIDSSYKWGFEGIATTGSSGGPVFTVVNGKLTGVGVTVQTEEFTKEIVASSLPLNELLNAISS